MKNFMKLPPPFVSLVLIALTYANIAPLHQVEQSQAEPDSGQAVPLLDCDSAPSVSPAFETHSYYLLRCVSVQLQYLRQLYSDTADYHHLSLANYTWAEDCLDLEQSPGKRIDHPVDGQDGNSACVV